LDPSSSTDRDNSKFKTYWEEVAADKTKGKFMIVKDEYIKRDQKQKGKNASTGAHDQKVKTYDWTKVTKEDFEGTYKIKSGDMVFDSTRLWKCVGKAADCTKTQPKTDATRKIWQISVL